MEATIQKITPFLWFDTNAEEAARYYTSIFKNSRIVSTTYYEEEGAQASGMPKGSVMTVAFELEGQHFVALNGGPVFKFTEAISFVVTCDTQEEIDYYWESLAAGGDPSAQQCGWLKDRFGVSWQIIPALLPQLLTHRDPAKGKKAMQALLNMKRIDMNALKEAAQ